MADWQWGNQFGVDDDENDEDGEGGYQKFQWGSRDGLIFLIDCSKSMFERNDDESHFQRCIKCAMTTIQNKVISSEKDLLGIVFFGTKQSKNDSEFKNICVLHDLDLPGAERVLELEGMVEGENDDFTEMYGHSDTCSISDALWTCSNMFSNCTQKLGFKRVMLFTDNDNPHGNNAQLRRQAAAKAEDLHQNGIDIQLLHMSTPGQDFDVSLFYKDILITDDDEATAIPDPAERFEELMTRVRGKDHKKRALTRIPMSLGKGMNFSVGVYNLQRLCYTPARVRLYKKTNEEVKSVTKTFLEETGEILMPQDMKKSQTYGGKKINFETEEVAEIKKFDVPGMTLMGFKPRSSIKRYFHVRPAQFIYPDETTIEGSTSVFTAMLKKCLERDVVAICRYIPRRNTPPKFVALIPQAEEFDEHKVQVAPPGFQCIFLPFADDFRKVKFDEDLPRANTDQIEKAKELIKKLQFPFRSDNFENPALQTHYANIEAMALDRDAPEEITDYTLPDDDRINKRAGQIIQDFKDLVFPDGYTPGQKKRAAGGAAGGVAKKAKVEVTDIDLEKEAQAGKLGKLTVPVLKECIKKAKIRTTATKKADLIDAINSHFGL